MTLSGVVPTDILRFAARVVVTPADAPPRPRGIEGREETADDHVHADHGPFAAALRSPASESRPAHWGHHRRHRARRPSVDGAWVAAVVNSVTVLLDASRVATPSETTPVVWQTGASRT